MKIVIAVLCFVSLVPQGLAKTHTFFLKKNLVYSSIRGHADEERMFGINPARTSRSSHRDDKKLSHDNTIVKAKKSSSSSLITTKCRGGACKDSDPALFLKIALSAATECAILLGVIVGSTKVAESSRIPQGLIPDVFGLSLIQLIGLVAVIFAPSFFGAIVDGGLSAATNQVLAPNMTPGDPDWFVNLKKPVWNPPGWLFPIMWLIVSKPTQLVAVAKILKKSAIASTIAAAESEGSLSTIELPIGILAVYCAQLSIGDAWNKVFFELQCPGRGAAVITAFLGTLLTSAYLFFTADEVAGKFMLPTCGWVLIATALNWSIYLLNKNEQPPA